MPFNGYDGMFTSNGLPEMLSGMGCRSIDNVLLFVAVFIDWSTKYTKIARMTRVPTRYSKIVADIIGDMEKRAWGK